MSDPLKPVIFSEVMSAAREAVSEADREVFEVYLDAATIVTERRLKSVLEGLPVSDEHKVGLIAAEAYSLAQTSHLDDVGGDEQTPTSLLNMLDELGIFGFDCLKNCDERKQLYNATGAWFTERVKAEEITFDSLSGGIFTAFSVNRAFQQTLAAESPDTFRPSIVDKAIECRKSPDCQAGCPLPQPGDERYRAVIESVVDLTFTDMKARSNRATSPE